MNDLGSRIKEVRMISKLTQEKFAEKLSIARNTITLFESNKRTPSDRILKDMAREFGFDYFWLKDGIGEMILENNDTVFEELALKYDLNDVDKQIIETYATLEPYERKMLKELIIKIFVKKEQN